MAFDFKLLPRCGAKTRSRHGAPCQQAIVMNGTGRCHWHGGASNIRHGNYTKKAINERRAVQEIIKTCSQLLRTIKS